MAEEEVQALTAPQAARELGVSEKELSSLISAGKLRASKVGGAYLIRPEDLKRLKRRKG